MFRAGWIIGFSRLLLQKPKGDVRVLRNKIMNAGCSCITESGMWCVHYALSVLWFFDFSEKRITRIRVIPNDNLVEYVSYSAIIEVKGKLYLFPRSASHMWIYDVALDQFEAVNEARSGVGSFSGAYRYREYIYAMPFRYSEIMKYDCTLRSVTWLPGPQCIYDNTVYVNSFDLYKGKWALCAVPHQHSIAAFDTEAEKWWKIDAKDRNADYSCVSSFENNIYAFDWMKKQVVELDFQGDCIRRSKPLESDSVTLVGMRDGVALSYTNSGRIVLLDRTLEVTRQIDYAVIDDSLNSQYVHAHFNQDNTTVYALTKGNELILIRPENEVITISLSISDDEWENLRKQILRTNKVAILENGLTNLEALINYFC